MNALASKIGSMFVEALPGWVVRQGFDDDGNVKIWVRPNEPNRTEEDDLLYMFGPDLTEKELAKAVAANIASAKKVFAQ